MGLIDFHAHILPGVDDGAAHVDESLELLRQERDQGVSEVICTPHFYPEHEDLEEHLAKTRTAFCNLAEATAGSGLPTLHLGCELHYYPGIRHCSVPEALCLAGTNLLLLELPFLSPIDPSTLPDLEKLHEDVGFQIVLAHAERYADDRQYKKLLALAKKGVVSLQINADSLLIEPLKKPAEKLLKQNLVSFVGSDAHHPTRRPVQIKRFMQTVHDKYPGAYSTLLKNTLQLENRLKGVPYD